MPIYQAKEEFQDVREKRVREIGRARRWEEKEDGWKRDAMWALLVSSVDRKPIAEYQGNCSWNCSLAAMRVFDEFLDLNALYATADERARGGEV